MKVIYGRSLTALLLIINHYPHAEGRMIYNLIEVLQISFDRSNRFYSNFDNYFDIKEDKRRM